MPLRGGASVSMVKVVLIDRRYEMMVECVPVKKYKREQKCQL